MFQFREWPEGFEFPACIACNHGTDDHDLLISVFARMNPFAQTGDVDGKLHGLIKLANMQYPGMFRKMLPSASEARRHNREFGITPAAGQTHQETGVVNVPEELHDAVCVLGRKLAKGVFYRDTSQVFPDQGCLLMNWFTNADLIRNDKYVVFDLLKDVAGDAPPTIRTGKYLRDQFEYKLSLAPQRNVFILQARFGGAWGATIILAGSATNMMAGGEESKAA